LDEQRHRGEGRPELVPGDGKEVLAYAERVGEAVRELLLRLFGLSLLRDVLERPSA
jgi:hypothetical protein